MATRGITGRREVEFGGFGPPDIFLVVWLPRGCLNAIAFGRTLTAVVMGLVLIRDRCNVRDSMMGKSAVVKFLE